MCDPVRGIVNRSSGPAHRGVVAGGLAARPTPLQEMAQLVAAIAALDVRVNDRAVPPPPLPSRMLIDHIDAHLRSAMAGAGIPGPAVAVAAAAVKPAFDALGIVLDGWFAATWSARRLLTWWALQDAHNRAVQAALVQGIVNGIGHQRRRIEAELVRRGPLGHQNLFIAAASPRPDTPAGPAFWMAATAAWVANGIRDHVALTQAFVRPDEAAVLLLQCAYRVLSLAFAPGNQAIPQAQQLGAALAAEFGDEVFEAIFPSVATVTVAGLPLSEVALLPAAAAQALGPRAEFAISPLLVPLSLGAFIGPLLVEIALELLAPQVGWVAAGVAMARRSGRVRRVVQGFPESLRRVAQAVGPPGGLSRSTSIAPSQSAGVGAVNANAATGVDAAARMTEGEARYGSAWVNPAGPALTGQSRPPLPAPGGAHLPHPRGTERGGLVGGGAPPGTTSAGALIQVPAPVPMGKGPRPDVGLLQGANVGPLPLRILTGETARTGGIVKIRAGELRDEGRAVLCRIEGWIFRSAGGTRLRNFNTDARLRSPSRLSVEGVSLSNYQYSHLFGPRWGDEARDGLMLAPETLNQVWQNHGVETFIDDIAVAAQQAGGRVFVVATAKSFPRARMQGLSGREFLLKEVEYEIQVFVPGKSSGRESVLRVSVEIDHPAAGGRVHAPVIQRLMAYYRLFAH